ncbi:LSM domain protein [Ancylostoma duodenale]|uniref:U6 snRNA-associated Sm-like protein LSm1 n=1 Tax=Ancylostoma duodenale TaxID=51022 RepID=A0A0C2H1W5_9BILA|nr:LSM domain protein [Ancylostoma duodenale]
MDLPDPYLPGAISLFEQLDKKLVVVLRDGRKLIGYLKSIDQFANLILEDVVERTFVDKYYCDINQGFLLIRGENVEIAGEIDESIPMIHQQVRFNVQSLFSFSVHVFTKVSAPRPAPPAYSTFVPLG